MSERNRQRDTSQPPRVESQERSPLATMVSLRTIRLERLDAEFHGVRAGDVPTALEIGLTGGCAKSPDHAQHIRTIVELKVAVRPEGDASRQVATVTCKYVLEYRVLDAARFEQIDKDDPDLNGMMRVAVHMSWPFARETVLSATSKMGLPPLVLPSITFGADGTLRVGGVRAPSDE